MRLGPMGLTLKAYFTTTISVSQGVLCIRHICEIIVNDLPPPSSLDRCLAGRRNSRPGKSKEES